MISESKGQKRHRLSGHPDPDPFLASFEEPMSNIPRKLIPKLSSLCPPEWTVTMLKEEIGNLDWCTVKWW